MVRRRSRAPPSAGILGGPDGGSAGRCHVWPFPNVDGVNILIDRADLWRYLYIDSVNITTKVARVFTKLYMTDKSRKFRSVTFRSRQDQEGPPNEQT
jgi:hypothetical protein